MSQSNNDNRLSAESLPVLRLARQVLLAEGPARDPECVCGHGTKVLGQCFTCHNVNGNGGWELIGKAMNVNDKGVPNSPTTGLIPPSEGGR